MSDAPCPSMSDLSEPAQSLLKELEDRLKLVNAYFDDVKAKDESTGGLSSARFSAVLMYQVHGDMLKTALKKFIETCGHVESAV